MSFIAITYGYNQFSIFNTYTSTLSLIDNIISICLDDINNSLEARLKVLLKEIDQLVNEEENTRKEIKRVEGINKVKEEEKVPEVKPNETKGKQPAKGTGKQAVTNTGNQYDNEIKQLELKLQGQTANTEKYKSKKDMLNEYKSKFISLDRTDLKIDLVDINGDRANIDSKGDLYANSYLQDRQCYELHKLVTSKCGYIIYWLYPILYWLLPIIYWLYPILYIVLIDILSNILLYNSIRF